MGKIQLLDDKTINKIAAGEVVERPAAIIREVLENAIDAGATDIRIELEQGGVKMVRVQDNGCGMTKEDALLSLQRHATSKIASADDLFAIRTLGFRGEAVPSIASVSQLEMRTRVADSDIGTKIVVHGGKLLSTEDIGCPVGTIIISRNLFFNIPARQKFLRAEGTEYSHCLEAVIREMLIRPHIDLEVKHNKVMVLRSPVADSLHKRAISLLGNHWGATIPVEFENSLVKVTGLISPVGVHRATSANATYLYVNNRFVKDTALRRAVSDAYMGILPKGRYPLVLLSVEVDIAEVDVNVHPAKTEVRFQQVHEISESITTGLRSLLQQHGIRREVQQPTVQISPLPSDFIPQSTNIPLFSPSEVSKPIPQSRPTVSVQQSIFPAFSAIPTVSRIDSTTLSTHIVAEPNISTTPEIASATIPTTSPIGTNPTSTVVNDLFLDDRPFPDSVEYMSLANYHTIPNHPRQIQRTPMDSFARIWPGFTHDAEEAEYSLGDLLPVSNFSSLRVIGQLKKTYILCEGAGELVIIDQHAAHERITLDQLQRNRRDQIGGLQRLLTPILVELSAAQLAKIVPYFSHFAEYGLEMEEFGTKTVAIRQVPQILEDSDWNRLLLDIVDDIGVGGKGMPIHERIEAILSSRACHNSIRAGATLSVFQMQEILEDLDTVDFGVCAHGRPVAIRVTPSELEKRFHRN